MRLCALLQTRLRPRQSNEPYPIIARVLPRGEVTAGQAGVVMAMARVESRYLVRGGIEGREQSKG